MKHGVMSALPEEEQLHVILGFHINLTRQSTSTLMIGEYIEVGFHENRHT